MSNPIHSYPKIYNLGHDAVRGLTEGMCDIEEKVDGSQFSFMVDETGQLHMRSKGAIVYEADPPALFKPAVETAVRIANSGVLPANMVVRGEAFHRPKHNVLAYNRAPEGGFILFDAGMNGTETFMQYGAKVQLAEKLGVEVVNILMTVRDMSYESLQELMQTESALGGQLIEGVVIKPWDPVFGKDGKQLLAKHVSEGFKEVHSKEWSAEFGKGRGFVVDRIVRALTSEARWNKAVMYLDEQGLLTNSPKDIGAIIARVKEDIEAEEGDRIRQMVFAEFLHDILKGATRGLPDWYKERLARRQFEE